MSQRLTVGGAIAYGLTLSAIVIIAAGYYESLPLLGLQIALIAGPSALPFLPIALGWSRWKGAGVIGVALLVALGWGYVVYVDTRPYVGGGASMAIILGWMTCTGLFLATLSLALIGRLRMAYRDDRWRARPNDEGM